jgi:hypothetical protein
MPPNRAKRRRTGPKLEGAAPAAPAFLGLRIAGGSVLTGMGDGHPE